MTSGRRVSLAVAVSVLINALIFFFPSSPMFYLALPGFFTAMLLGAQGVHGDPISWIAYVVNLGFYFVIAFFLRKIR